jgi:hypothetical protein
MTLPATMPARRTSSLARGRPGTIWKAYGEEMGSDLRRGVRVSGVAGDAEQWLAEYIGPLSDEDPSATATELARRFQDRRPGEYAALVREHYSGSANPHDLIRRTVARWLAGGTGGHAPVTVHLVDSHGLVGGSATDRTIPDIVEIQFVLPRPGAPAYTVSDGVLSLSARVAWERPSRRRNGGVTYGTVQAEPYWDVGNDGVPRFPLTGELSASLRRSHGPDDP